MSPDLDSLIQQAEAILPGVPSPEEESDPRWQAIIGVGEFVETHPEQVWEFVDRWGGHEQDDLRMAVATCLLEHLLEHHFEAIFPRVASRATQDRMFADTFMSCAKFARSLLDRNERKFDSLIAWCRRAASDAGPEPES